VELEFETIESEQMDFSIDVAHSTLALNQCCSETPLKILFQRYRTLSGLHAHRAIVGQIRRELF
jgi:hypothetical protein